jgi:hypothetical protein
MKRLLAVFILFLSLSAYAEDDDLITVEPGSLTYTAYFEIVSSNKNVDKAKYKWVHLDVSYLEAGACYLPGIYTYEGDGLQRFYPLTPDAEVATSTGYFIYPIPVGLSKHDTVDASIVVCLGHVYPPPETYTKHAFIGKFKLSKKDKK